MVVILQVTDKLNSFRKQPKMSNVVTEREISGCRANFDSQQNLISSDKT